MFIHRLVYHLHNTFENDNRRHTKKQWRLLAKEIHFVVVWMIKMLFQHCFTLERVYDICMSTISPLLPNQAIVPLSMGGGMSGGMSTSPNLFAPTTPDEVMGGTTPHPLPSSSSSSSSSSTSFTSSSSSSSSTVDTAAGMKEWWASKDFDIIRRAYTSLARRAHLTGGKNASDSLNEHMRKLLSAMHVNPTDTMGGLSGMTGRASPGSFLPGSTTQFGSPLASPINMTPQYGNTIGNNSQPSASPGSSQGASPGSSPGSSASPGSSTFGSASASASPPPNGTPSSPQPSGTPLGQEDSKMSDIGDSGNGGGGGGGEDGQPPMKRARIE